MLTLISSYSLHLTIHLFSQSKLAFHNSPACEIVSRIMPVTNGEFLYSYFICNIII